MSTLPQTTGVKTAIVTGACSGIGLALTRHLLSHRSTPSQPYIWRVVLVDIRPDLFASLSSSLDPERTLFVPCDVSSWDDNTRLFSQAFSWSSTSASTTDPPGDNPQNHSSNGSEGGRIDFLAANAGTDDKEQIQAQFDLNANPAPPNLKCVDVNLISVFYQLKLFIHYARKTRRSLREDGTDPVSTTDAGAHSPASTHQGTTLKFQPKITITSSCVGQYAFPPAPQYAATKHALLGLVRSTAASLYDEDDIAINAVMPAFVPTNLAPEGLVENWPREHVTPIATVITGMMEVMDEFGRTASDDADADVNIEEKEGGRVFSDGTDNQIKRGCCVECVQNQLFYRETVPYPNESQRWMLEEQTKPGGLWVGGVGYGGKLEREKKR